MKVEMGCGFLISFGRVFGGLLSIRALRDVAHSVLESRAAWSRYSPLTESDPVEIISTRGYTNMPLGLWGFSSIAAHSATAVLAGYVDRILTLPLITTHDQVWCSSTEHEGSTTKVTTTVDGIYRRLEHPRLLRYSLCQP